MPAHVSRDASENASYVSRSSSSGWGVDSRCSWLSFGADTLPLTGQAFSPDGTVTTARDARRADECPELHERLIVSPRGAAAARQERARDFPDLPFSCRRLEVGL